jgi:hypothetical protein
MSSPRILFVINPGRSGSTLLARVLGSHPLILSPAQPFEPHLLEPLYYLGYFGPSSFDPPDASPIASYVVNKYAKEMVEYIGEGAYLAALRAYSDGIYRSCLARGGGEIYLDKTPRNLGYREFIGRLYPDQRVIVLTRHPLAMAFSTLKMMTRALEDATPPGDVAQLPDRIVHMFRTVAVPRLPEWLVHPPMPTLHVRYEDFVTQPADVVGRICDFLSIPFRQEMLELPAPTEAERQHWHAAFTSRQIVPDFVQGWTRDVAESAQARDFARRILDLYPADTLRTLGYDRREIEEEFARACAQAVP